MTVTLTLADGRSLTLRPPTAGDLRGIKLLDVLQLDPAAHGQVIARIADFSAPEFYALAAADTLALMTAVVGFFTPMAGDPMTTPPVSKTPGS